ncbi:MAG: hypothetical protein AB7W16_19010 [Candidatus Obscuribacterales bacterium]
MAIKTRSKARLSVNKLGEYLEASARRRERILRDQKFPKEFITLYYRDAFEGIQNYIDSEFDDAVLDAKYEELGERPTTSVKQVKRISDCIHALESFQNLSESYLIGALDGTRVIPAPNAPKEGAISLEGVEISLRPEFYLQRPTGKRLRSKGLIKLYISRNQPLSKYTGQAIAALSQDYLSNLSTPEGKPSRDQIMVIDVFAESVFAAPKSTKRLMQDVEASCREITRLWDQIKE